MAQYTPFKAIPSAAERQQVIDYLIYLRLPPIPVAPRFPATQYPARNRNGSIKTDKGGQPLPAFTGKNPSYVDANGIPHLIGHKQYQDSLPSSRELETWFENESTGVGTLGGWNGIIWVDWDVKSFDTLESSDHTFNQLLECHPHLRESWIERTQSGGWRLAVQCKTLPKFTNFKIGIEGHHIGEALGAGRFTVLAPTTGPSGNRYENINRSAPVEVESLEALGILPTKTRHSERTTTSICKLSISSVISLEDLGNRFSRRVLNGEDPKGDRSNSLATAIYEWSGWANWCRQNGINISGGVEELAQYAGERLGLEGDRCDRILASVDTAITHPAALKEGGEESCWRKIRSLDRHTYEVKCPKPIQKRIGHHHSTYTDSGGNSNSRSSNRWNAPQSWQGELGWWVEKEDENGEKIRQFIPKANFDFVVERELCSPNGDGDAGLILKVKRSFDKRDRRVVLRSLDRLRMVDFVAALTQTYGHDIVCILKPEHLHSLIHVRLLEYHQRGGKIYKLADRVGCQEDGFWVFPEAQYTPAGEPCTEEQSGWVHNNLLTSGEDKIPEPVVASPDSQALPSLLDAMTKFYGPEVIDAAVFCLGYGAAALHYQEVMKCERRFPILNPVGDPGSFKTLVAECALSLSGNHRNLISRSSESAIYERLKRSGNILQCWDDPQRSKELDELFKRLYNGEARSLRRVFQEPHAPLMATSNHALGDDQPATRSRVVSVPFYPSSAGDRNAWDELKDAMDGASGALPQLIQLGYPAKEIRAQAQDLRSLLPLAHVRVADSFGLVLWYAKAVARLAGYPEERPESYVKITLCAHANDAESNRSSLEDFLDNCQTAVAQSKIGGWNIRAVENREGKQFIAIHMQSVWAVIDKAFTPMYSRQIVENGILKAGGNKRGTQKFYRSEDETKAYLRALIQPQGENSTIPKEPETVPRKCVVIPAKLSWDLYEAIMLPKVEQLVD